MEIMQSDDNQQQEQPRAGAAERTEMKCLGCGIFSSTRYCWHCSTNPLLARVQAAEARCAELERDLAAIHESANQTVSHLNRRLNDAVEMLEAAERKATDWKADYEACKIRSNEWQEKAKKLERERDEARGAASSWQSLAEAAEDDIDKLKAENARLREQAARQDGPCYYCHRRTNSLAGNPGEWPVYLCHGDEPGVAKAHHAGCVMERLAEGERLREHLAAQNK